MTHYDCDYGILDSMFGKNKSGYKKTMCGKVVTYEHINNKAPSCPDCVREDREMMEAEEAIRQARHV